MLTPDDRAHLKALSICWYVFAGLSLLGALCGGFYMLLGVVFMLAEPTPGSGDGPGVIGGIAFLAIGGFVLLLCIAGGILDCLAAQGLARQRRRTLIYVMAAIACLYVPLGTVLGVFTFIVISRPTVKAAFAANAAGNPATGHPRPPAD